MICYKDKTFCASDVDKHTCNREITQKEKDEAILMDLPVAYAEFCNNFNKPKND